MDDGGIIYKLRHWFEYEEAWNFADSNGENRQMRLGYSMAYWYLSPQGAWNTNSGYVWHVYYREYLNGPLPETALDAEKQGWNQEGRQSSRYHQNTAGDKPNLKYTAPDGREAVYTSYGALITHPNDIGTLNFGRDGFSHLIMDVIPYWFNGNSDEDTTPWWRRIVGK